MRHAIIALLAALPLLLASPCRADSEADARAALALAVANQGVPTANGEQALKAELCPCCRDGGYCPCTPAHDDCGCYARNLYHWVETSDPDQAALYRGDRQVGNYWFSERQYRELRESKTGDRWIPAACPVRLPKPPAKQTQPVSVPPLQTYMPQPQYAPQAMPSFGGSFGGFSRGGGGC